MRALEQMRRLSFAAFAPGRFRRDQYEALSRLLARHEQAVPVLAALNDLAKGTETADFEAAVWRTARLAEAARDMAAMLERVHPAAALGLAEKLAKIDFYLRLGLDQARTDPSPPHVTPGPNGRSFTVTPGACEYFMESAALGQAVAKRLRLASLDRPEALGPLSSDIAALVLAAAPPEDLTQAIAQAAEKIAKNGAAITAQATYFPGQAGQAEPARIDGLAPRDCPAAYLRLIADKYAPPALAARIAAGFADAETPLTVVFCSGKPDTNLSDAPAPPTLRSRLAKLAAYLAGPAPAAKPSPGPDSVTSLAQAVRYAREAAMAEAFAQAGGPGRGPAPKHLRTERPAGMGRPLPAIDMEILDLGDGLFHPDQLGPQIDPEHIKSGPMWALWCGLAGSPDDEHQPHTLNKSHGRAMITDDYTHLTLAGVFGEIDIDSAFPRNAACRINARLNLDGFSEKRRENLAGQLRKLEFSTRQRGPLIDAVRHDQTETAAAKALARLGRALAWM